MTGYTCLTFSLSEQPSCLGLTEPSGGRLAQCHLTTEVTFSELRKGLVRSGQSEWTGEARLLCFTSTWEGRYLPGYVPTMLHKVHPLLRPLHAIFSCPLRLTFRNMHASLSHGDTHTHAHPHTNHTHPAHAHAYPRTPRTCTHKPRTPCTCTPTHLTHTPHMHTHTPCTHPMHTPCTQMHTLHPMHTHAPMHTNADTRMHTPHTPCTCTRMHTHAHAHPHTPHMHMHARTRIPMHTHTPCRHTHARTPPHARTLMHPPRTHTHAGTPPRMHTHARTHTLAHEPDQHNSVASMSKQQKEMTVSDVNREWPPDPQRPLQERKSLRADSSAPATRPQWNPLWHSPGTGVRGTDGLRPAVPRPPPQRPPPGAGLLSPVSPATSRYLGPRLPHGKCSEHLPNEAKSLQVQGPPVLRCLVTALTHMVLFEPLSDPTPRSRELRLKSGVPSVTGPTWVPVSLSPNLRIDLSHLKHVMVTLHVPCCT